VSDGALQGLRVLELTQVMAGPFCGQVLADMGADVVKVEPPGGDSTRRSLGFRMRGDDTAAFLAVNRNKRSLALDLKDERHRAVFHRLVRDADVVLENYRPGVAARLGADWEILRELNPRLVYASISGFGQTGPYAMRPGYDLIAQGLSGVMSVTGEPGGDPVKCGVPVGDLSAGLFCAVGREDLVDDPRFATIDARMENRPALVAEFESALAARGTEDWVEALIEAGVPCGPIHDYAEVFADPHTQAREMEVRLEYPVEGTIHALGIPVKLSATPGAVRRPAPLLGEHTEEVLREAGLRDEEIAAL
jgi:crotonobetainyl-CoA:carnitine CoA-transferase CaiB-like acyl-CoA transferase